MKIYVASSWKNILQPNVVSALRENGHDVYDFKNPPNKSGFAWKQVDKDYQPGEKIDVARYKRILDSPVALQGYKSDMDALLACQVCVAVLPFGKSASWELGYAKGQGKKCFVLQTTLEEPELMFRDCTIVGSISELISGLNQTNKYMVIANEASGSVFVKEKDFFISQGGDKQPWGVDWIEITADTIEDARRKGCSLFPHARPYHQQAK